MPAFHGLTFTEKGKSASLARVLRIKQATYHTDWGVTDDAEFEQQKDNKFYVYFTAKIKAETALWDFAHAHPELEVATSQPCFPSANHSGH